MVPGIWIGRTECLAEDLKRFVPGVDPDREKAQVSKNLPEIGNDVIRRIEKAEKELIRRYYRER